MVANLDTLITQLSIRYFSDGDRLFDINCLSNFTLCSGGFEHVGIPHMVSQKNAGLQTLLLSFNWSAYTKCVAISILSLTTSFSLSDFVSRRFSVLNRVF